MAASFHWVETSPLRLRRGWRCRTDDTSNVSSSWSSLREVKCYLRSSARARCKKEKKVFSLLGSVSVRPPEVSLLLSTPLWCLKEGTKVTPAHCCRCCLSPWRRCSHHFRGGCRRCWWVAWLWKRRAAGASSCWFCALWPGDSGTRSSPGGEEKLLLPELDRLHESHQHAAVVTECLLTACYLSLR